MPKKTGPQPETPDQFPPIREVAGDAIFLFSRTEPEIPPEQSQECPQCHRAAWVHSRWCWNCKFDFDRAKACRIHPSKLVFLLAASNVLLAAAVLYLLFD